MGQVSTQSVAVLAALPGSSLTIRGSTTIGARWHCTSTGMESRVAVAGGAAALSASEVRGVWIFVPVSALRCQTGAMERAMRHALKADRDTAALSISGVFEIADTVAAPARNEAHLIGVLRVAGVERIAFLRAMLEERSDGILRVRSVIPLRLTDFDITLPRVLFGAVRARDAITVEVDLAYPSRPAGR